LLIDNPDSVGRSGELRQMSCPLVPLAWGA